MWILLLAPVALFAASRRSSTPTGRVPRTAGHRPPRRLVPDTEASRCRENVRAGLSRDSARCDCPRGIVAGIGRPVRDGDPSARRCGRPRGRGASILGLHEGASSRSLGTRTSGRRDRPRRRARDRAEAGRAGRARALERPRPRPAAAARGRRADPDPDHARHVRSRRAVRAPPLLRAPAGRGRAPALPRREGRDRAADRERLLLRLRVPGADLGGRPRAHRGGDPARSSTEGRSWTPRGDLPRRGAARASRPSRSRSRSSSSTPRKATSRSTRRATSPTSAAARTSRTRSRSRR